MCKLTYLVLAVILLAGWASAQVPAGNIFFGYSYYSTKLSPIDRANTNGWNASLEGKVIPWVGIVVDFSSHYGSETFPVACPVPVCQPANADITERNLLFGPRVSVSVGKVRPFAEAMIGAGHVSVNGGGSDTSLATAVGGGLDYKLIPLLAWRVQGDYVQTRFFSTTQNNVRISTGIVLHF